MPFLFFDPLYFVILAPALILMLWAQFRVKSAYHRAMQVPAPMSGAAAAQHILDSSGLHDVAVEETHGFMSDHYDPRAKVLRLSPEVYRSRSAAAVGIAAHEAGHALQDATNYGFMAIRSAAVPAAMFGGNAAIFLLIGGVILSYEPLIWLGILGFGAVALFQIINLPVEFDASSRAKRLLGEMGIVQGESAAAVGSVLNAAAWTYVAATLQAILTVAYYIIRFTGGSRDE